MCMSMRGVQKPGTRTVTTAVRGAFAEDFQLQQTFFQMVRVMMERVNRIWDHPLYREAYARKSRSWRQDREILRPFRGAFPGGGPADADLRSPGRRTGLDPEELVYAAALLHDIGRHLQYREGIRRITRPAPPWRQKILPPCGFSEE